MWLLIQRAASKRFVPHQITSVSLSRFLDLQHEILLHHQRLTTALDPVYAGSTGPYDNHMNIQLTKKLTGVSAFDEFICDLIIDGLTALAVEVAPELVEADLFADVEFQALCADLVEHIGS